MVDEEKNFFNLTGARIKKYYRDFSATFPNFFHIYTMTASCTARISAPQRTSSHPNRNPPLRVPCAEAGTSGQRPYDQEIFAHPEDRCKKNPKGYKSEDHRERIGAEVIGTETDAGEEYARDNPERLVKPGWSQQKTKNGSQSISAL